MEGCSVAVATARGNFVGRQEHCFYGRQLPGGRGGREWREWRGKGGRRKRMREGRRKGGWGVECSPTLVITWEVL